MNVPVKYRRYAYRVLVAAGPVAILLGWATSNDVVVYLGLGSAILGVPAGSLAVANTPGKHAAEDD